MRLRMAPAFAAAQRRAMTSFLLYVLGFFVLLAGLVYGAVLLHVAQAWIIVGALVLTGCAVMSAGSHIKRHFFPAMPPDPSQRRLP